MTGFKDGIYEVEAKNGTVDQFPGETLALVARRDEQAHATAALELQQERINDIFEALLDAEQDVEQMPYAAKRRKLAELGSVVTVYPKSITPRFTICTELPIPAAESAGAAEPWDATTILTPYRVTSQTSQSDNSHQSMYVHNNHSGLCAGTAGDNPQRSRRGRRRRFRW